MAKTLATVDSLPLYHRVNGEWKFQNLKLTSRFWTPFDEGWVKTRFA